MRLNRFSDKSDQIKKGNSVRNLIFSHHLPVGESSKQDKVASVPFGDKMLLTFLLFLAVSSASGDYDCEKNWFTNATVSVLYCNLSDFDGDFSALGNESHIAVISTQVPILCKGESFDLCRFIHQLVFLENHKIRKELQIFIIFSMKNLDNP